MSDAHSHVTDSGSVRLPSVPHLSLSSIGDYADDDPFASTTRRDGPTSVTNRDSSLADAGETNGGSMTWARKASVKQRHSTSEVDPSPGEGDEPPSGPPRRRRKSKRSDSLDSVISGMTTSTRSILKRSSVADLSSVLNNGSNNPSGAYTDRPANRRVSLARRMSFKGAGPYSEPPTPAETTAGGAAGGRKRLMSLTSTTPTRDFGHVMGPLNSSRWPGAPEGGEKSPRGPTRKGDSMMNVLRSELMRTHKFKFPDRLAPPKTNRELDIRKEKSSEDIIVSSRDVDRPPLQKRLSMPLLTRKDSDRSIGSESDEVFLSSFQRRKVTLLTSLEKMGVKLPKRGRKYSNKEADVLKRAAEAQRHGSLTSRTLLSNFDTLPPKKQSVAQSPEKPLDEATKNKLQFIFDTMTKEDATVTTLPGLTGRHRISITENDIAASTAGVFRSRLRRRKVFTPTLHKLPPVIEHDGSEAEESKSDQSRSSAARLRRTSRAADDVRIRCLLYNGDAYRELFTGSDLLLADKGKNLRARTDANNNSISEAPRAGDCDVSGDSGKGLSQQGTRTPERPLASKASTSALASKKSRSNTKRRHVSAGACATSSREALIHNAMGTAGRKEVSATGDGGPKQATARRIRYSNHSPSTGRTGPLTEKSQVASLKLSSPAVTNRRTLSSTLSPVNTTITSDTSTTRLSTNLDDRLGRDVVRLPTSKVGGAVFSVRKATAGVTRSSPHPVLTFNRKGRRSARASNASSALTPAAGGWRGGYASEAASRGRGGPNFLAHREAVDAAETSVSVRTVRRQRQRRKKRGSNRFRNLAKFVCLLLRAWRIHSLAVEAILDFHQSVDVTLDTNGNDTLLFDITEYKADKEARMSAEAIRILKKRPKERTSEEIHYVQIALWNYKSLAEYPVHMQKMIAERAWFESYGAKRVIVREGHHPMGFYFLLSGSALVSVMDMDKGVAKTIMYYNRGDSFGELAIMNGSRRQSTVISKESIQLLVLSDSDFVEVFMSGGLNDPEDPFLNSLSYLDGWPKEKLGEHPKKANYHYFKRRAVLVADSHKNDWIIIVKSGSLNVLKKLRHVDAKKVMAQKAAAATKFDDMLMDEAEQQGHVTHEDRVEAGFQQRQENIEQMGHLVRFYALPQIFVDTNENYNEMKRQHDEFTELHGVSTLHARELAATAMSEHRQQLSRGVSSVNFEREPTGTGRGSSGLDPKRLSGLIKKGPFMAKSKREGSSAGENTEPTVATRNNTTLSALFGQETPSSATELDQQKKARSLPPAMFVNVQTLTKGMVFGLSDLFFENPSMSLVSNGAECISISKKLFMEHASHAFITRIREDIYPYPTEEDLQENIESQVMWDFHRRQTVGHVVHDIIWTRSDKNDARLNIPSTLSY